MVKKKLYGREYRKAGAHLGGLTTGSLFGRPHAGPGNVVASAPMGPQDAPYWRHDRAYQRELDRGRNPYLTFQPSDQKLMDDLSGSWNPLDLIARGAFGVKKFFSDTPQVKPAFKAVYSNADPVRMESLVKKTGVVFPTSMGVDPLPRSKKAGKRDIMSKEERKRHKKRVKAVALANGSLRQSRNRPPGSGIYVPERSGTSQNSRGGGARIRSKVYYEKNG